MCAGMLQSIASWTQVRAERRLPRPACPPPSRACRAARPSPRGREAARLGLEIEYTWPPSRDEDPYRSQAPGFIELNALGEIRFGLIGVSVNALNLTDGRQTHWQPLLRPAPGPGGDPITDERAPLAGGTFNLGLRAQL